MSNLLRLKSRVTRVSLTLGLVFLALLESRAMRLQGAGPFFEPVGLQADRGYFSELPWEAVDMVNGSLILRFTDLSLPGNADMDLRVVRVRTGGGSWSFGIDG